MKKQRRISRMKRLLALILCMSLAVVLFAACSTPTETSDGSSTPTTPASSESSEPIVDLDSVGDPRVDLGGRVFRVMGVEPDVETEVGAKRQERLEEIKEWYNCEIEFIEGTNEVYETLYSSILAGDPIMDLAGIGQIAWFMQRVATNVYYPVSDLDAIDLNHPRWNKGIMDMYTYQNKNYTLASSGLLWGQGLFVNVDLLKRNGVTEDVYDLQRDNQWTWDKFLEFAQKATTETNGVVETWGLVDDGSIFLKNMIVSFGGSIIIEDSSGYSFGLNDAKSLAALTYYQDLSLKEKVYLPQGTQDRNYGQQLFKAGRAAFYPGYPWFGGNFGDMTDDYAFVRFPMKDPDIGTVAIFDWPGANFIPATVDDPQAVGVFANAFYAPDPTLSLEQRIKNQKESWSAWFRDERALDETATSMWMGDVNFEQYYLFIDGNQEWGILNPFFNNIALGQKTPASAAEELTPQMTAIIKEVMGLD